SASRFGSARAVCCRSSPWCSWRCIWGAAGACSASPCPAGGATRREPRPRPRSRWRRDIEGAAAEVSLASLGTDGESFSSALASTRHPTHPGPVTVTKLFPEVTPGEVRGPTSSFEDTDVHPPRVQRTLPFTPGPVYQPGTPPELSTAVRDFHCLHDRR